MIELLSECDLPEEALCRYHASQLRSQLFYSDMFTTARIGAEIYGRHAAVTELPLDTKMPTYYFLRIDIRVLGHFLSGRRDLRVS
jgi:hypothetical protein